LRRYFVLFLAYRPTSTLYRQSSIAVTIAKPALETGIAEITFQDDQLKEYGTSLRFDER